MSKLCLSLILSIVVSANGNLNQMLPPPPPPPQRPTCPNYTSQQNIDYSKVREICK